MYLSVGPQDKIKLFLYIAEGWCTNAISCQFRLGSYIFTLYISMPFRGEALW